jgi:hypothetical protein
MNTLTLVGKCLDPMGHSQARRLEPGRRSHLPELRTRSWATPAGEVRRRQPAAYLTLGHSDHWLGRIVAYERDAGGLWAVCVCHDLAVLTDPDPWYYSAELTCRSDGTDIEVTGMALTHSPASVALPPVEILVGDLARTTDRSRWHLRSGTKERIERAARHAGNRGPITLHDELALAEERRELEWRRRARFAAR